MALQTAHAATVRYEAEDSPAACDGTIDSNHTGYSGSGFCNSENATGATATFTIDADTAGTATLALRYANGGTGDRPGDITVNGTTETEAAFAPTGAWTTWETQTVAVPVNAGTNTIQLTATTENGLANLDYIEADTAGGEASLVRFEAENSPADCDGTIDSNHAGYSGTGFCNSENATGATLSFTIETDSAATAELEVGFANGGTSNRSANVSVNGSSAGSLTLAPTGAWTTWDTETITVGLAAGTNTVTLAATTG
ncbi:carbohydrate-binding protein, partial [Glycomyces arizonensis]|uniref:carbohydrate-binding protein n=1 Tax=Glycomyces arizonensis TaxID=256035 RepID=UPI001B7F8C55